MARLVDAPRQTVYRWREVLEAGGIEALRRPLLVILDNSRPHRSHLVRDYVAATAGRIQLHFLPGYAPELNPVEFLWGWLKRHALANFCPDSFAELQGTTRSKLKSAQRRSVIIASCWRQAELF